MKKIIVFALVFLLGMFLPVLADNLKGAISGSTYADYMQKINLTESQKEKILRIKEEEKTVIKPFILDVESKEEGLKYLKTLKCGAFDFSCKKQLKQDKEQRKAEEAELMRKIGVKKNYYETRYKNVLTREQDYQIRQMAQRDAHIDKVLEQRAKRQKSQARKEKLKFWKKRKN